MLFPILHLNLNFFPLKISSFTETFDVFQDFTIFHQIGCVIYRLEYNDDPYLEDKQCKTPFFHSSDAFIHKIFSCDFPKVIKIKPNGSNQCF